MSSNSTLSFELDESRQVHHAGDHVRAEPELILTKDYSVWEVLPDEENDSDEEGEVAPQLYAHEAKPSPFEFLSAAQQRPALYITPLVNRAIMSTSANARAAIESIGPP
ncbi:hypothetical protein LTR70_002896 [Exophiala xenobiotica]|uniref:Uncharacterized protein n=1 Tax=Lithohypha guttulata TaxID=1690604 RepID=A0ABR0KHN9_9EURO|nr:hypothetical protein LTR24_002497 [Lithohypha guttulata]KAK5324449.1 hypothetical protein LTR70_002896 [Exophiala xenobiotica]